MKILLTGSNGQVGYELARSLQPLGEVLMVDRSRMNLSNLVQVRDVIRTIGPDVIVNPAAYTAVDKAESEPELAMRINAEAPAVMAEEALRLGAALVHFSTDYVFDGAKNGPYGEDDLPNPLNVYGCSKLAGEQAIKAIGPRHLILRTSWVYGLRGANFLLTMLRLAKERDELRVVGDQWGAPTWSRTIADVTAQILAQVHLAENRSAWWDRHGGIYHLASRGETNWYDFAAEILRLKGLQTRLVPITSREWPTPAQRPLNSRLSCEALMRNFCSLPDWRAALRLSME